MINKYEVEVTKDGQLVDCDGGHSRTYAMQLARKMAETCHPDEQVYITWYRASDGQKGYLNPDGSHYITGRPWKAEQKKMVSEGTAFEPCWDCKMIAAKLGME